jgi:hypothetical protein
MILVFTLITLMSNDSSLVRCKFSRNIFTRGDQYKLYRTLCHFDLRKLICSIRLNTASNSSPDFVVSAPSVDSFMNRLDKFLVNLNMKF